MDGWRRRGAGNQRRGQEGRTRRMRRGTGKWGWEWGYVWSNLWIERWREGGDADGCTVWMDGWMGAGEENRWPGLWMDEQKERWGDCVGMECEWYTWQTQSTGGDPIVLIYSSIVGPWECLCMIPSSENSLLIFYRPFMQPLPFWNKPFKTTVLWMVKLPRLG